MLTEKGTKRVIKEIKDLQGKKPEERCFSISLQEDNLQCIYAIIRSMDGDYQGGEYILKIKLPDNYPYSPPVICCLTPNGRFSPETNICLNISHFHAETWSPLITLEKLILSVMSIFYDNTITGVGSVTSTPSDKRKLAESSIEYNKKYFSQVLKNELN